MVCICCSSILLNDWFRDEQMLHKEYILSKRKTIVSLTSYPKRIYSVAPCVESILNQSVPADSVMLWLGEDEFPGKDNDLPYELLELLDQGLEIHWYEKTLFSHDKYFWVMQQYPDCNVVTTDDDLYYQPNFLEKLFEGHKAFPDSIIANRTHKPLAEANELKPYAEWVLEQKEFINTPTMGLLATGVGGIFYPAGIFDKSLFDRERILEYCPTTDDLWLYIHEIKNDISIVSTIGGFTHNYVSGTQEEGLFNENLKSGGNDASFGTLFSLYPEIKQKLLCIIDSYDIGKDVTFKERLLRRIKKHVKVIPS